MGAARAETPWHRVEASPGHVRKRTAARVVERAQEALDAFVASADGPAVTTTASVRVGGSVIYPILRYAEEIGVGLVVVSTHGRTGFDRLVMGNVAQDVVRMLPCAVLTMRPGDRGLLGGRARAATEGNRAVPAVEPDAAR